MTQSKTLPTRIALCVAVALWLQVGAAGARDGANKLPEGQDTSGSPLSEPAAIEPNAMPQPTPTAQHAQSEPAPAPAVKQEPTMPPRASAPPSAPAPAPAARSTTAVGKAATTPPTSRSVAAPVAQPAQGPAPAPAASSVALAASATAGRANAGRTSGPMVSGPLVSAPVSRLSTVELATLEAVGYAAGAMLLGSVTTLAAMSLTARRRRKTLEPGGPVVSEKLSPEPHAQADAKGGPERIAAAVPETQVETASRVPNPSLAELCEVAEQWAKSTALEPDLLSALNLPAKQGSLYGLRAGMVSVTGPVRKRNEDACLLLQLDNGATVLMAADGMGGHPDGHLASRLALIGACVGLREALHRPMNLSSERLLQHAFARARRLLRLATHAGRLKRDAGTTMILTLVESDHYVTAYLGDGGAYVRRADGSLVALMQAQKVESTSLDRYLAANAPQAWKPEMTRVARCSKDMLAIGSDGVMDRVDIGEVLQWLASNVATKGQSMTRALRDLVEHCSTLVNSNGDPLADDNMTLVAVHMR
jgi:serine/threonine protein phosphatase PrpC